MSFTHSNKTSSINQPKKTATKFIAIFLSFASCHLEVKPKSYTQAEKNFNKRESVCSPLHFAAVIAVNSSHLISFSLRLFLYVSRLNFIYAWMWKWIRSKSETKKNTHFTFNIFSCQFSSPSNLKYYAMLVVV